MKRLFLAFATLLSLGLAACGGHASGELAVEDSLHIDTVATLDPDPADAPSTGDTISAQQPT